MKLLLTGISFILLFTVTASAQEKDSSVQIIFSERKLPSTQKKKKLAQDNIIKIAPLGFISGTFPVYFEHSLNDFASIQLGVGATGRNYARSLWTKGSTTGNIKYDYPANFNANDVDFAEQIYGFDSRKASTGYLLSIQPRFYFFEDGLDGSFVALSLDHYRYNFNNVGTLNSQTNTIEVAQNASKEFENINDFTVHFGYQSLGDKLSFEYTSAVGLRNVSGSKYAYLNNGTGDYIGALNYKQNILTFNIGIKVGYIF